jgi:hypothetical protein
MSIVRTVFTNYQWLIFGLSIQIGHTYFTMTIVLTRSSPETNGPMQCNPKLNKIMPRLHLSTIKI